MDKLKHIVEQSKSQREKIISAMNDIVESQNLLPPYSMQSLNKKLQEVKDELGISDELYNWALIMFNNAIWRKEFAKIPYEKRILLLPQCLKKSGTCKAKYDEVGLLCEACGACKIDSLLNVADDLGMLSVVTDSTSSIQALFESGQIDGVVGVSCLKSMQKSFEPLLNRGIAAIAIPLLKDGCKNTDVDSQEVIEALTLHSESGNFINFVNIKQSVCNYFIFDKLKRIFDVGNSFCEVEALKYLCDVGNRWRPSLLACIYFAISQKNIDDVKNLSIAIECFHKASLIHDDIEDDDDFRDGVPTLHKKFGISHAINIGDYLIGFGYDLVANFSQKDVNLTSLVSKAHRLLCLGQGQELAKSNDLSLQECLDIYYKKTSVAFELAMLLGCGASGEFEKYSTKLKNFAFNLGIAYQLFDDLRDFEVDKNLAIKEAILKEFGQIDVMEHLNKLFQEYKLKAFEVLDSLDNVNLKRLLFSVMGKLFEND